MNEIVNMFLLGGDKFMPETHLRQSGFTNKTCESFTTNKERIHKLKETGDSGHIYQKERDKACFQHDMTDGGFKHLTRTMVSDKILGNKAFNIAKNTKHFGYQSGLASMVYISF